jgi:hypothetical protein
MAWSSRSRIGSHFRMRWLSGLPTDEKTGLKEVRRGLIDLSTMSQGSTLGARIAQFAALALIPYGTLVIVVPTALPLSGAGIYML